MNKYCVLLPIILILSACLPIVDNSDTPIQEPTVLKSVESEAEQDSINPECLSSEMRVIGENISQRFDFATEDQVMTWFCGGAEFKDILIALQTEKVTGQSTQELLEMLVNGLSWDEIWQSIGFLE